MSEATNHPEVTALQRRFCDEFLVDFNATAAYLRAGYKTKPAAAAASASRLLGKLEVAAYLSEKRRLLAEATDFKLERLVQEIKAIALFDPRRLFKSDGSMLPPHEWPDDVAAAVGSVDVDEIVQQVGGRSTVVGYTRKLRPWNKLEALEKGLRLLNAYPEQKKDALPPGTTLVGVVVVPAKQPWVEKRKPAIDGQASQVERAAIPSPAAKAFKVLESGRVSNGETGSTPSPRTVGLRV